MTVRNPGFPISLALLGALLPVNEPFAETEFHGALAGFIASGTRALDDVVGVAGTTVETRLNAPLGSGVGLRLEGLAQEWTGGGESGSTTLLREAALTFNFDPVRLRVGRQVIAWGRADRFNPTDNLTARDFELLTADDEAQRMGVTGIRADVSVTPQSTLTAVLIGSSEASRLPAGLFPAGVDHTPPVTGVDDRPQVALKWDTTGENLEGSISWFDGYSTLPALFIESSGRPRLIAPRMRALGADFAAPFDAVLVRGEAALATLETDAGPAILPGDYFYGVLSMERSFGESGLVSLALLHREAWHRPRPDALPPPLAQVAQMNAILYQQTRAQQESLAFRIGTDWDQQTLLAELGVLVTPEPYGYAIKPKVTKVLDDHWKVIVMADLLGGSRSGLLGRLRDNSLAFAELRYEF